MIVTAHSNKFESFTRPAEKPSTGCFVSSAISGHEVIADNCPVPAAVNGMRQSKKYLSAVF